MALGRRMRGLLKGRHRRVRLRLATSPLPRCRETARILAASLGLSEDVLLDIVGLLGGHGLLSSELQIQFVREGTIRVLNRLIAEERSEVWLHRVCDRLTAFLRERLDELHMQGIITNPDTLIFRRLSLLPLRS